MLAITIFEDAPDIHYLQTESIPIEKGGQTTSVDNLRSTSVDDGAVSCRSGLKVTEQLLN